MIIDARRKITKRGGRKLGKGILNSLINNLPISLHIPGGYNYCGPGTKIKENLAKGVKPLNKLDAYCMEHDIFYDKYSDTAARNKADLKLADQAWQRVKAGDASIGERAAAYAVTNAMKLKAKLGMGIKRKKNEQLSTRKTGTKRTLLQRRAHAKRAKRKTKKK